MTVRELIDQLEEICRYAGDHHKVICCDWSGAEGTVLAANLHGPSTIAIDVDALTVDNEDAA